MKHIFVLSVFVTFLSCLCACSNYGYSGKVVIPKEGGIQEVKGDEFCYNVGITDYNGQGSNTTDKWTEGPDTSCVKYEWLIVKTVKFKSLVCWKNIKNIINLH